MADKGIDLPVDPATITVTAAGVSAYYVAVRALERRWPALERRWPALGVLFGSAKTPVYPARVIPGHVEPPRM